MAINVVVQLRLAKISLSVAMPQSDDVQGAHAFTTLGSHALPAWIMPKDLNADNLLTLARNRQPACVLAGCPFRRLSMNVSVQRAGC